MFHKPRKSIIPLGFFLSKQVPIVEALEGCQEGPAVVELFSPHVGGRVSRSMGRVSRSMGRVSRSMGRVSRSMAT